MTGHECPEGENTFSSTLSSTSAQDGVSGQRHTPAALTPGKTRYQCTGGWVGHRAGLDGRVKSRPTPEFDPRTVQTAASPYTD
jgi:hypothetical protein